MLWIYQFLFLVTSSIVVGFPHPLNSSTVFLSDPFCDPGPDKVIHFIEQRNASCILVLHGNLSTMGPFCWSKFKEDVNEVGAHPWASDFTPEESDFSLVVQRQSNSYCKVRFGWR